MVGICVAWFVGLSSLRLEQLQRSKPQSLEQCKRYDDFCNRRLKSMLQKNVSPIEFHLMGCVRTFRPAEEKSVLEVACSFRMPTNITNPKSRKDKSFYPRRFLAHVAAPLRCRKVAVSRWSRGDPKDFGHFRTNASPCPHPWCWYVYATNWMFFCGKCSAVNVKKHVNVTWMI